MKHGAALWVGLDGNWQLCNEYWRVGIGSPSLKASGDSSGGQNLVAAAAAAAAAAVVVSLSRMELDAVAHDESMAGRF